MADVGFELFVLQARVLQLQVELQEADVRGVGQARTVLGVAATQARLAMPRSSPMSSFAESPSWVIQDTRATS